MLDIKRIREQSDYIKEKVKQKFSDPSSISKVLELDMERRSIIGEVEALKAKRNQVTQDIAALKKEKKDAEKLIDEMKGVSLQIKDLDAKLGEIDTEIRELLLVIPNIAHQTVPQGKSAEDNIEIRSWSPEPHNLQTTSDHLEIGKRCGILDFERGAKISGSGFPLYIGKGATLERALINYFLDFHIDNGFTEIFPPFLVNEASMIGTGQLPKFADDMYTIEKDELFLIPTAEVPVTNIYRDEVLKNEDLTMKMCAYTACFRREAGSYGKDTKGFLRTHQFNKVEMVKYARPDESYDELEFMVNDVETILKNLNIPYRILLLCAGDLSFNAAKCYDVEVWSPVENKYLEASSCSNFEDYQARRANIRYKPTPNSKPEFVHTLNGSGLATSRLMVSLLEHNSQPDGSIRVPEVLIPYTRFEIIEPVK